jgi:peptidoglycan/LPS O-acetylase OafA/YrhL
MGGRYDVLDGLRGTAALSVVTLHLCAAFRPDAGGNPMHHGYLAVDFFFMLSGFVMGHAYDGRWARMSLGGFFARRLVRLHPLVVLGAGLGAAGYLLGNVGLQGTAFAPGLLAANLALAALLLPAPSLPGLSGLTHSLNTPAWSLTQEYLANLAYGLVGRWIGRGALAGLVGVCAVALAALALSHGGLDLGWSWRTLWLAPARTAFAFFAGLLLQRTGARLRVPGGWPLLSVVLVAAFAAPVLAPLDGVKLNGLFEAALVIGLFPLVIAAGAASPARGVTARLCRLSGEISYPLYILHAPFARLYAEWAWTRHAPHALVLAAGAGLAAALPLIAWITLKLYDEPIRARLSRTIGDAAPAAETGRRRAAAATATTSPG